MDSAGTIFFVGVVLAIMILPIVTAICREVFEQAPTTHQEGRLALGATRWEMIRMAVLPYGSPAWSAPRCSASAARSVRPSPSRSSCHPGQLARPWSWSIFNGG